MITFLTVAGVVIVCMILITGIVLVGLMWWAVRHPSGSHSKPARPGGTWEFECACPGCRDAVQPSITVTPSARHWGHVVPRDSVTHETVPDAECFCGPEEILTIAGPCYVHRRSRELAS